MRPLLVPILLALAVMVSCGSPTPTKRSNDATGTNASSASNNAQTNSASTNSASTNSAQTNAAIHSSTTNSATNNQTTGPSNSSTNNSTAGATCEVLTSDSDDGYCNLQATCGDGTLLTECVLEDVWYCYCGEQSYEYDFNPCSDPDVYAPVLAEDCGTS